LTQHIINKEVTYYYYFNAAVHGAMEQAIPRGYSRKSKFPPWFSHTTLLRRIISVAIKRNLRITFTTDSLFTGNLLKALSSLTGLGG
jgi:hypothetical protein